VNIRLEEPVSTELLQQDRTAEVNIRLEDSVSTETVRRELNKSNIHCRAEIEIDKLLTTESNAQMRKLWCQDHKT
jgi:hypothetical protein